MQRLKLNDSGVVFNEGDHTYFLNGKQLQGVTGILHRRLFADKYDDVPKSVLDRAAERGKHIHKMCEMVDDIGASPDCAEALAWKAKKDELGLESVASEYLITDGERYASAIDAIYYGEEGGVILNDRKTTYKLDTEYVSWQLSIYAVMFEAQNPDVKVEGLSATWMRGDKCEYVAIERKPDEAVRALLAADKAGEDFHYESEPTEMVIPQADVEQLIAVTNLIADIKRQAEEAKKREEELKEKLKAAMEAAGIKSWDAGGFKATVKAASTRNSFDAKKFQTDHPELYEQYIRATEIKSSITITLKKETK